MPKPVSIFAFLLTAQIVFAQQQPPPNVNPWNNQDQSGGRRMEQESAAAAQTSQQSQPLSQEPTFADILRNPDNADLNLRYARAQIRAGDLRGAATTLERLVMLYPDDVRVRLLYAVVLFRLDDSVESQRELETVLAAPALPADVRSEAQDYLAQARSRQRDTHYDARLSFGFGYDNNRNAAPAGGIALFQGIPVTLDSGSQRRQDTNLQFTGSLGVDHDFGGPQGHSIFARVTYYRGEQTVYHLLNLQAYSAKLGGNLRTPWLELMPSISFDHVLLDQSTYLRSRNAGLRVQRRLSRDVTGWTEFGYAYQDYLNTPQVGNSADQKGEQFDFSAGASWNVDPADQLTLSALHRRKNAQEAFWAYRRESGTAEWLRLLGRGTFFLASFTAQFDHYGIPDPTITSASSPTRIDADWQAQALIGAPLSLFWAPLKDFTGTLGYQYFRQSSNVVNYDYANHQATVILTYKWGT